MNSSVEQLEHDIFRIDTAYMSPGVAACYLIRGGDEYALVECGSGVSVDPILSALDSLGVERASVKYIIPTHVHLDHAGGAGGLMRALPNAQLHVHPRGARHLIDPSRLLAGAMAVYGEDEFRAQNGEILPVGAERCHEAPDQSILDLGGRRLELRDAPGHAKHHLVVWDAASSGFFTGDVFGLCYPQLAINGQPFIVPTTTPVQFDPAAWHNTLAMMASYTPERMYLTHYGCIEEPATLAEELADGVDAHALAGREKAQLGESGLAEHLSRQQYARYQAKGGELDKDRFDAVLNMDLRLNAQGLIFWVENIK
ncbi:MAG: MBL fold metallo-hydrolase [Oceanococcus sp.]